MCDSELVEASRGGGGCPAVSSGNMTPPWHWFLLLGLLVAGLEEFITQGVLKGNLRGWIVPTLLAFVPFLVVVRLIGRVLGRKLSGPGAALVYYLAAGSIGLLFEWFVMGLSPWSDPSIVQIPFQFGMFSFWSTVACAPHLLLDSRAAVSAIRRRYLQFLGLGFLLIYGVAFTLSREARFGPVIATVLFNFILLNGVYLRYLRALKPLAEAELKSERTGALPSRPSSIPSADR